MEHHGKFPFRDGSLLKDVPWKQDGIEWRDKEEFDDALTLQDVTAHTATWVDAAGHTFPMFLSDLKAALLKGAGGVVRGRWTTAQRGTKYGILLADAPKRERYHHYQVRGVYPKFKYANWIATDVREISQEEFHSLRQPIQSFYDTAFKKDFPPPSFYGRSGKDVEIKRDFWGTRTEPEYKYYAATWCRKS